MYFYNLEDAKEAIIDYAIPGGYNVHFKKSDKDRVRAECVKGCPWFMLVSRVGKSRNFRIKTMNSKHNCGRSNTNKLARKKWLAKKLTPIIMCNPNITSHQVVNLVREKWMIDITVNMAYRDQWPKSNTPKLEAPTFVKKRGRPQRKRKKQPGEDTNKDDNRKGLFQTCSKCNMRGHNKRTCPKNADEEDTDVF
ncbi:hypothetical protein ACFE04_028494 [Oxalis oulophora]